jgi:hypothetical protein
VRIVLKSSNKVGLLNLAQELGNIAYAYKNILLFWDGAGWHRGSVVQDFIKEDGKINVVYFPPYSPEENPQEHVWKAGRSAVTHNKFIPDIEKAAQDFIHYLNSASFPYKLLHLTERS